MGVAIGCKMIADGVEALTNENAELRKRAMPEGYEWPRYEDGSPVLFGDTLDQWPDYDGQFIFDHLEIYQSGELALSKTDGLRSVYSPGERVKRPSVLAADGEPLEVGQTVWDADGMEFRVESFDSNGVWGAWKTDDGWIKAHPCPTLFTHQCPVLDTDGVPIHEGDTVWFVSGGEAAEVAYTITADASHPNEVVLKGYEDDWPVNADKLTHTKPDSWDALWDDIENCAVGYESFMRRCRALAERERSE